MSRRRAFLPAALAVLVVSLVTAGCTTAGDYAPTPLATRASATAPTTSATSSPAPSGTDVVSAYCLHSYAPPATLPTPGQMPSGTTMRRIQDRGRLIAGVSADTLLFGSRNPVSGKIEGFDIDFLHAISRAIFGGPDRIEYRVITAAQRQPLFINNSVDIVARNMTIRCDRWEEVAFSSEYYRSGQKVLVRRGDTTKDGAPITSIQDLSGMKVCAPNATSSMEKLRTFPELQPVGADTHTECLVLFQQGKVDAITGDETVLAGLAAQDPFAVVVQGPAFTVEPYGLGVNRSNVDFVEFVNGVLEQLRADGQWTRSYNKWLADALGQAPAPPVAVYGRNS
jgi:polar amino acid transport system substrate-binding protein